MGFNSGKWVSEILEEVFEDIDEFADQLVEALGGRLVGVRREDRRKGVVRPGDV